MKTSLRQSSMLVGLSTLLFLFIFWITLAPTQLGGPITYVIVDGNSMQPGFYRGDLALVRSEPAYGAGDAVVYQDPQLGSFVFHRIIDTKLDRFVLKGDNNSWLDSYQPTQDEIVGKLWAHIPKLGRAIEWMRVPLHMALLVAFLGGVLMVDMFKTPSHHKKEKNMPLGNFGGTPEIALYGFGFFVLVFLVTSVYSFTRPLNRPAENIQYKQEGYYFYSAAGTPGLYDTELVRAGEPVFPKLTCFLNVAFNYNVASDRLQGISGSHNMVARIVDEQSGWLRTIPLSPDIPFNGNSFSNSATLDLCQVESLVNLVEQEAGLYQMTYTLEIVTNAAFTASADGRPVRDSFAPALVFKYDKVHFYVDPDQSQADPLYSSMQGMVDSATVQPNIISLFGLKLPVWIARFISLAGFGVFLYGLIAAGMNVYRAASQSQEALIRLKYGALLVDVHELNIAPASSIIDVAAMDDLARLAERQGAMILHMTRNFLHYYFVQGSGMTYRYVVASGRKGIPVETEPADYEPENYTEPVSQASVFVPAPAPEPVYSEAPQRNADRRENKIIYASAPQNENTQPVLIREPGEQEQAAKESIEYFINAGGIEFDAAPLETAVLRKIKL